MQITPDVDMRELPQTVTGVGYPSLWQRDPIDMSKFEGGITHFSTNAPPIASKRWLEHKAEMEKIKEEKVKIKEENKGADQPTDDGEDEVPPPPPPIGWNNVPHKEVYTSHTNMLAQSRP